MSLVTVRNRTMFKGDGDSKTRVDLALEREAAERANWRTVCQLVDARDGRMCRSCGRKSDPEAVGLTKRGHRHHIVYRSAGGPDATWNVCTLCFQCHDEEHVKRTLGIEGNADVALTLKRKDEAGEWYVWRQEIAVHRVEKD